MITERAPLRRIVTGHDAHGRSIIDLDSDAPHSWSSDTVQGFGASVAWATPAGPIDNATPRDAASADADIPTFPPPGGTILRVADFPPDEAYPVKAASVVFDENRRRGSTAEALRRPETPALLVPPHGLA